MSLRSRSGPGPVRSSGPVPVGLVPVGLVPVGPVPVGPVPVGCISNHVAVVPAGGLFKLPPGGCLFAALKKIQKRFDY